MSSPWRIGLLILGGAAVLGCPARSVTFQTSGSGAVSGVPAGVRVSSPQRTCRDSGDCMMGDECARPSGGTLGLCGTVVDADGRSAGRSMANVPRCERREDCPPLFTCRKSPGWFEGLCVR